MWSCCRSLPLGLPSSVSGCMSPADTSTLHRLGWPLTHQDRTMILQSSHTHERHSHKHRKKKKVIQFHSPLILLVDLYWNTTKISYLVLLRYLALRPLVPPVYSLQTSYSTDWLLQFEVWSCIAPRHSSVSLAAGPGLLSVCILGHFEVHWHVAHSHTDLRSQSGKLL